jgi:DNA-binding transcriptional MocR family regulator
MLIAARTARTSENHRDIAKPEGHRRPGTSRIEQNALADFLERGELDRHRRRMRVRHGGRRDAFVEALMEPCRSLGSRRCGRLRADA